MNDKKEVKFDFWNDHSLEFLEMAMKRDFQERVDSCAGYGKKQRDCGDTIEIFLDIKANIIESISYDIQGCLYSHACANTLIHFARGKSIAQARQITPDQIIAYLKTLPKQETHCAEHALAAFFMALDDFKTRDC